MSRSTVSPLEITLVTTSAEYTRAQRPLSLHSKRNEYVCVVGVKNLDTGDPYGDTFFG